MKIPEFQETVWEYARHHSRSMPWRENTDPYYVLVSELMLQQTQVGRVISKFQAFIARFPTVTALADATLSDVLTLWNGLGYNRRAKFLWESARMIQYGFDGKVPDTIDELTTLPGVGNNTASAILAYAYNQPVVFIETNIRTVFFYHFFNESSMSVSDQEILKLVEQTLDVEHPREWYWALMDCGTHLKKQGLGTITQSSHYRKQSPLKGSIREVRGQIIKALTIESMSEDSLKARLLADERFSPALTALLREGLVKKRKNTYSLH